MVVDPDDPDHEEAHDVAGVRGPLLQQRLAEPVLGVLGHVDLQHEQRDGDREHAVAERLDPAHARRPGIMPRRWSRPSSRRPPSSAPGSRRTTRATAELLVGFHKKGSGRPSITWPESVDAGALLRLDRRRAPQPRRRGYTIRFTPRKPRSTWSAVNVAKVDELIERGLMRAGGPARVRARAATDRTGIYSLEQQEAAELPPGSRAASARTRRPRSSSTRSRRGTGAPRPTG